MKAEQFERRKVLDESLIAPILIMYESDAMIWKKEISRITVVHTDSIKGLFGIKRIGRISNA